MFGGYTLFLFRSFSLTKSDLQAITTPEADVLKYTLHIIYVLCISYAEDIGRMKIPSFSLVGMAECIAASGWE